VTTPVLPNETVDALQRALAAEHAAIWLYGLVSAFLPTSADAALRAAAQAHTARRDALTARLKSVGATPKDAQPGYTTPRPVTNQPSALAALVAAETDTVSAWRSVLEYTSDSGVRKTALDALTDAAVRAMSWREQSGQSPVTPALPGQR
jgi:Domain of unknown function (DUF4439)